MNPRDPMRRRALLALGAGSVGALASPALVRAETPRKWRLVTSWPRTLPGPGDSARRLAERLRAMSDGRLDVQLFAAGEIVPAFAVLDAVSTGVAEMGHTASFFWAGKMPAATLFTTAPFGMGPVEHQAWIQQHGGQALWDRLYAPFQVRAFLAGNTGPSLGGWFRKEIRDPSEIASLRIRVQGLGGEVYKELGATPMAIPPGDVFVALERGTIDAVELLAPSNDLPLGLHRYAPFYYAPGFNKPNGAAEALVSEAAWADLPPDLQAVVRNACEAEHAAGLADAEAANAGALAELVGLGVKVTAFSPEVLALARKAAETVIDRIGSRDPLSAEIVASYRKAAADGRAWARLQGFMSQQLRVS